LQSVDVPKDTGNEGSWLRRSSSRSGESASASAFDEEYERRKLEWAAKYTDVSTLRRSFGTNRNKLWGDFDPETTRKLYHTLLPRALMALSELGVMSEQELAPLAYEARCAAKKYARERSMVPGRIFSMAYDGFRSWRNHGKWNAEGMTWDQVWEKYERQIVDELADADADADELSRQICLRILERSCRTNPKVDKIFLGDPVEEKKERKISKADILKRKRQMDIAAIAAKLERDVHELLFQGAQKSALFELTEEEEKQRRKVQKRQPTEEASPSSDAECNSKVGELLPSDSSNSGADDHDERCLSPQEVAILRKFADAKRKVVAIIRSERLVQKQLRQEMLKRLRKERAKVYVEVDDVPQSDEIKIFVSDLAAPSPLMRAHSRKKVWQARSDDDALPQRRRGERKVVRPREPARGEV